MGLKLYQFTNTAPIDTANEVVTLLVSVKFEVTWTSHSILASRSQHSIKIVPSTFVRNWDGLAVVDDGRQLCQAHLVDQLEVADLDEGDVHLVGLRVDVLKLGQHGRTLRLAVV